MLSKIKSACNKSYRSSHKDSITVEFAFLRFLYDFLGIFEVCCFEFIYNFSFGPLTLLFLLKGGPWRTAQNRAGKGAMVPGEGSRRRWGKGREKWRGG